MHDGWQSYWQYGCDHALCNVHHLRELTFLSEEQQQVWADQMITLLLDIKAAVEQARAQGRTSLHPLEVQDWKAWYEALLDEGYQANPPDPPPVLKKGRRKQSAARNLLDRLSKHQEAVLLFLDNFAVPFDNSLAERDIRMVKFSKRSLAVSARWEALRPFVASAAISLPYASKDCLSSRHWNKPCAVILFSLLSSPRIQLHNFILTLFLSKYLIQHSFCVMRNMPIKMHIKTTIFCQQFTQ